MVWRSRTAWSSDDLQKQIIRSRIQRFPAGICKVGRVDGGWHSTVLGSRSGTYLNGISLEIRPGELVGVIGPAVLENPACLMLFVVCGQRTPDPFSSMGATSTIIPEFYATSSGMCRKTILCLST